MKRRMDGQGRGAFGRGLVPAFGLAAALWLCAPSAEASPGASLKEGTLPLAQEVQWSGEVQGHDVDVLLARGGSGRGRGSGDGSGQGQNKGSGYGPGDGSGTGEGPKDGTGYGAGQGSGSGKQDGTGGKRRRSGAPNQE